VLELGNLKIVEKHWADNTYQ